MTQNMSIRVCLTPMDINTEKTTTDCVDGKTTNFADDGVSKCNNMPTVKTTNHIVIRDNSIIDFLAKPYLVSNYAWSASDLLGSNIVSIAPNTILASNALWASKLEGFSLMRGTVVIKVTLNCNPFQQGKLLLHFLPGASEMSTTWVTQHNANVTTKTTQVSVELNANMSSAIMKIPYVSPYQFYSLIYETGVWGTFYITVLSPLRTGLTGSSFADLTTYLSFEDVELAGPLVPQGATGKKRVVKSYKLDAMDQEVKSKGAVSSLLSAGAQITGSLTQVPFLTAIATPVTMVLDGLSGVAAWFGWSKPRISTDTMTVARQANRYMGVTDGTDPAVPLSLNADQRLAIPLDASWTTQDEMSFNFLKQIPALVTVANWTTSQTTGTSLYSGVIGPSSIYNAGTSTVGAVTVNWRSGPPVYTLHPLFSMWRGSFNLTVKLVKTEYHTGRIQITWTPGYSGFTAPTTTTGIFALREIVDLSMGEEITLNLPYMLPISYVNTYTGSGQLDIVIINDLRAPETAAASIDLLMYFSAGEDFEYQNPCGADVAYARTFVPQMGGDDEDDVIINAGIGNMPVQSLTLDYCRESVGESFNSVKQILGRYNQVNATTMPTGPDELQFWPWACGALYQTPGTGALASPVVGGDLYSYIQPMYAFQHGGVSVLVKTSTVVTATTQRSSPCTVSVNPAWLRYYSPRSAVLAATSTAINADGAVDWTQATSTSTAGRGGSTPVVVTDGVGFVNAYVPGTSLTRISPCYQQTNSNGVPLTTPVQLNMLMLRGDDQFGPYCSIYRRFSDDFTLHYFCGTVPLFISVAA